MRKLTDTQIDSSLNHKQAMDNAYRDYISRLAKESKDVVFINSSAQHAAIVLSTIFKNAKDYVKIFAGDLRGDVSCDAEYKLELENFLKRKGRLHIILEKYDDKEPINIADIIRYYSIPDNNLIEIKYLPNDLKLQNQANSYFANIHFCVADDKMFRIETDTQNYLAQGNFNDKETSDMLLKRFDDIFNNAAAQKIDLSKLVINQPLNKH